MATVPLKFGVISCDSHLQEGPDVWTKRMSKKQFGANIPEIRTLDTGEERWVINGTPQPAGGLALAEVQGALPDRAAPAPTHWKDIPSFTYTPKERIKALDADGVDIECFFPNIAGPTGTTFQKVGSEEFRIACMRAYNDHQAEEWLQFSPRFVPMAIVPAWNTEAAVAEIDRSFKLGHKGVVFPPTPENLGFPHLNERSWDPIWAAIQERGMVLAFHQLGGGRSDVWPGFALHGPSWYATVSVRAIGGNVSQMANILYSGIFERFPRLKLLVAESGIGFLPYVLETADHQFEAQKLWRDGMTKKPSEYYRSNVWNSFWYEKNGIANRHVIGLNNIVWESDMPHRTCTYPESKRYIEESMQGVPQNEHNAIMFENAAKLFNLDVKMAGAKK